MDWNQAYLDGNTPWDKGTPSPILIHLLNRIPVNADIVVPGCGTGNDVDALLRTNPKTVKCLDIATEAIKTVLDRFSHQTVVEPILDDFIIYGSNHQSSADVIVEHTCFCAIPVSLRQGYARACWDVLRPGGLLIGAFYRMPRDEDDITIGPPFQTSEEELNALFGAGFTLDVRVADIGFPERLGREYAVVMTRCND